MSTSENRADGAGPARGAGGDRRTLAATCTAHFVHDGVADALYVLLPIWAQAFGLSYAEVGLLRSTWSGAMALLQMPAGILAERTGERSLLAAGTLLSGIAVAALAAADSYVALAALMLVTGVGSAVQHPVSSSIISRAYPAASRRAALGVYNFTGDIGKMAVAAAMGLGAALIGWRSSIFLYGLVVAAVALLTLLLLSAPEQSLPRAAAKADAPKAEGWGFTNARGFGLLGGIHLIDSGCRTGFLTFLPFLLIAKGATVASIGFALAIVFIGGAAGKLVCGLLAERVGIVRTVIATECGTGLMILAVIAAPLPLALVLLMPLGIALNGTSSVLYGTVAEFVRDDRQSRSFGLFYTIGSIAGASAPLIFGLLSDAAGVSVSLMVIAALAMATVPLALLLAPHLEQDRF